MSEYKSRRERRLAQGGKAEHHGGASPRIALVVGLVAKKKRKAGGRVEGEAAKHHLGKRARGGRALNAKQDADDPDGPDRLSRGRPEFAVAMGSPRARGGSTENDDCEMASGGALRSDDDANTWGGPYTITSSPADKRLQAQEFTPSKNGVRLGWSKQTSEYPPAESYYRDQEASRAKQSADENERNLEPRFTDPQERADYHGFKKGGHVDKWIGPAREAMEKKGTVGSLHRALGVPEGDKIPEKKLAAAARRAPSGSVMQKKIQFAENVRK